MIQMSFPTKRRELFFFSRNHFFPIANCTLPQKITPIIGDMNDILAAVCLFKRDPPTPHKWAFLSLTLAKQCHRQPAELLSSRSPHTKFIQVFLCSHTIHLKDKNKFLHFCNGSAHAQTTHNTRLFPHLCVFLPIDRHRTHLYIIIQAHKPQNCWKIKQENSKLKHILQKSITFFLYSLIVFCSVQYL